MKITLTPQQKGLSAYLNLASPEFVSIDSVSVSRWERGTTTPHPVRAIKILRTLTNDLMPYLTSLEWEDEEDIMSRMVYERFYSTKAAIYSASYSRVGNISAPIIIEKTIDPDADKTFFESIQHFLHTSQSGYPGLEALDLHYLYKTRKLLLNVYIDKQSLEIVGHNLAVFFDSTELDATFITPYSTLPFDKLKPYSKNAPLAICSLSRFATSESAFDIVHANFVRFMAPLLSLFKRSFIFGLFSGDWGRKSRLRYA
ncbi:MULTISPECIES: hypothetical protein [unclassified Vibrio]|nr:MULTISPECIES: hypothetical protein [unclassified Vibrio]TKF80890.1 hypothetical protein FCV65_18675 [Vibrio sp. F13]